MSAPTPFDLASAGRPANRAAFLVTIFAAVSIAVTGCQPAAQDGNQGESAGASEAATALSEKEVVEMERGIWEMLKQGEHASFEKKLAGDLAMVGGEGVTSKQDLMSQLEGGEVQDYEIGDFQVMQPGSNVAMVTYRYSETFRPADADSAMTFSGWATSVWEKQDGTWKVVLHHASEAPGSDG